MRSTFRAARRRRSTDAATDPAASSAPVSTLRRGVFLTPGRACWPVDRAQRRLEVVEDEADRGLRPGRRDDRAPVVAHDEDTALAGGRLELGDPPAANLVRFGGETQAA